MNCPKCGAALSRAPRPETGIWICAGCGSSATTVAVLRRRTQAEIVNQVWLSAEEAGRAAGPSCPGCARAMDRTPLHSLIAGLDLDVCRTCHLVWFDPGERGLLPRVAPPTEPAAGLTGFRQQISDRQAVLPSRAAPDWGSGWNAGWCVLELVGLVLDMLD